MPHNRPPRVRLVIPSQPRRGAGVPALTALLCCCLALTIGGCRSAGFANPLAALTGPSSPVVLTPTASSAEVVAAVNANASRIQTYQAPSASISLPESIGLPLVQASIAAERPLRFRLRATTALSGPEIDLGSNDSRFWVWARRNDPPAVYTAEHARWATSPVRGQVPIEPAWLIDAIGLATLDPAAPYVGPVPRGDGALELRTQIEGPAGPQQRVYVIDDRTALIREQHVYDASGSLTASVFAEQYRYDAASGVSIPERVRLNVPSAGLELTIHTGPVTINAPVAGGAQLWSLPQIPDAPMVDLTNPGTSQLAPAGPWDLTGTSTTYDSPERIATRFGEPSPASTTPLSTTPGGLSTIPGGGEAPPSESRQTPAARPADPRPASFGSVPATRQAPAFSQPVATPLTTPPTRPIESRGFSTLPSGGRSLDR